MPRSPSLSPPVAVAVALPLVLALAVAALGIGAWVTGASAPPAPPPPDTRPLAVAPIESPDADGADCAAVLAALPTELDGDPPAPRRALADPVPDGVVAWVTAPRPVVLRCGLPRPAELTPTSALTEVNGVRWLTLTDGLPTPVQVTHIAVDRPVYVALTVPAELGGGALLQASDAVRTTLPAVDVRVR